MAHFIDTSNEFRETIAGSHTIAAKMELRSPQHELIDEITVNEGTVTVDETDAIRSRIRSSLVADVSPQQIYEWLNPLAGNELWAYRGVVLPSTGRAEYVQLGKFNISKYNVDDGRETFNISVNGYDYSRRVRRNRFLENYHIIRGTPFIEAIRAMLQDYASWLKLDFNEAEEHSLISSLQAPALTFGGSGNTGGGNAWDSGRDIASAIGCELLIDNEGICVLRPIPDFSTESVMWHYHEGINAQFMYSSRSVDDENFRNAIRVTGENTDNDGPIVGYAEDNDPLSPTSVEGVYGRVPGFFSSKFITTENQANIVAEARLMRRIALTENVRLTAITNPAIQVGNAIHIQRERSGLDESFIVERLPIGMTYEQPLQIGLRSRRTTGGL